MLDVDEVEVKLDEGTDSLRLNSVEVVLLVNVS